MGYFCSNKLLYIYPTVRWYRTNVLHRQENIRKTWRINLQSRSCASALPLDLGQHFGATSGCRLELLAHAAIYVPANIVLGIRVSPRD
jgi:hypothetical protein